MGAGGGRQRCRTLRRCCHTHHAARSRLGARLARHRRAPQERSSLRRAHALKRRERVRRVPSRRGDEARGTHENFQHSDCGGGAPPRNSVRLRVFTERGGRERGTEHRDEAGERVRARAGDRPDVRRPRREPGRALRRLPRARREHPSHGDRGDRLRQVPGDRADRVAVLRHRAAGARVASGCGRSAREGRHHLVQRDVHPEVHRDRRSPDGEHPFAEVHRGLERARRLRLLHRSTRWLEEARHGRRAALAARSRAPLHHARDAGVRALPPGGGGGPARAHHRGVRLLATRRQAPARPRLQPAADHEPPARLSPWAARRWAAC